MTTILLIILSCVLLLALLYVAWLAAVVGEREQELMHIRYAISLLNYNDYVLQFMSREPSQEEEFQIAALQQQLTEQARDIGIEFQPFVRPPDRS